MKQQKQSGFAHLMIITVILGLAVVGLLGYVFWQNFMQPKDNVAKTGDSSKVAEKDDKNPVADDTDNISDSNKRYIVLDDWGVKFKLPTDLGNNKITYHKSSDDSYDTYLFSTERVVALGDLCASGNSNAITRMTKVSDQRMSPPKLAAEFGGYYYYVSKSQDVCSNSSQDIQLQDSSMLDSLLMSVEKE